MKQLNPGEAFMSKAELEELLSSAAQLETAELERFVEQINLLLTQRKIPGLPSTEAELLRQINRSLPAVTQNRYNELRRKLRDERISPEEHQELLVLVDIVEQADAERLQHLIRLAQLSQVPLPDLMRQLGIHSPSIHA